MNNFGASIQEWEYLTPLGSDCRYIVPIVSNPMIKGVGQLLRIQKTRGKIPSVKNADSGLATMDISQWIVI